ncbi:MAG: hypothetical protein GC155_11430 [Alphaproteobacteria bacterium]|nr:hypothetical protein [Alphaproteobacteria bacterium]
MTKRMGLVSAAALVAALIAAPAIGQRPAPAPSGPPSAEAVKDAAAALAAPRTAPGYVAPRLKIGQPDLQGVWTNASNTNLMRPANFDSLIMSDDEAAKARADNSWNIRLKTDDNQKLSDGLLTGDDLKKGRGYNAFWIDPGNNYANVKGTWRTSWIVEPANGQIPYKPEARKEIRVRRGNGYDNPEERGVGERCLLGFFSPGGPPLNNGEYNNDYQITQSPNAVVIEAEMAHDARIIPLFKTAAEARAHHKPPAIKPYMGDSVGWWDGDSLMVETIDMNPEGMGYVKLSPTGKITERFTRYSAKQILYEFTVDDPATYTQVWKGEMSLNPSPGIYEYACHEGNYGMVGILKGGREADRKGVDNSRPGDRDGG